MRTPEIIRKLSSKKVMAITDSELVELISQSEVVEDKKIPMYGHIRIIIFDNHVIVQEETDKKEVVLRRTESIDEAKKFLEKRLETYDRLWDGCGCKIDYFI